MAPLFPPVSQQARIFLSENAQYRVIFHPGTRLQQWLDCACALPSISHGVLSRAHLCLAAIVCTRVWGSPSMRMLLRTAIRTRRQKLSVGLACTLLTRFLSVSHTRTRLIGFAAGFAPSAWSRRFFGGCSPPTFPVNNDEYPLRDLPSSPFPRLPGSGGRLARQCSQSASVARLWSMQHMKSAISRPEAGKDILWSARPLPRRCGAYFIAPYEQLTKHTAHNNTDQHDFQLPRSDSCVVAAMSKDLPVLAQHIENSQSNCTKEGSPARNHCLLYGRYAPVLMLSLAFA